METRPVFRNLSPLDHRYYEANRELFDRLSDYLSESASVRFCVEVEAALLRAHLARTGEDSRKNLLLVESLPDKVSPDDVYEEEKTTHHNIRALVRVIKRHLPDSVQPLVHLGATSVDILDTALALRVRAVVREVVAPLMLELEESLIVLARTNAETLQIGRTHGQHGVPITFGFAISEYVSRLGSSVEHVLRLSGELRGKLSGAMGAFNAMSMIAPDPEAFEQAVLGDLGLKAGDHATQMVQPEYLLRLLLEMNTAFGIVANLADDLRNLQRSEIDEVREAFGRSQVGSSTMPQKRNPWNCEHVKSLWKAFSPRVVTFFSDQISEHQRDLTNSASGRFVADYIAGFCAAVARTVKVVSGLRVNDERMLRNAAASGDLPLSEAAYTVLAAAGIGDAHERIRVATLESEETGERLVEVLKKDSDIWQALVKVLADVSELPPDEFFASVGNYTGRAAAVTRRVCDRYESTMIELRKEMSE